MNVAVVQLPVVQVDVVHVGIVHVSIMHVGVVHIAIVHVAIVHVAVGSSVCRGVQAICEAIETDAPGCIGKSDAQTGRLSYRMILQKSLCYESQKHLQHLQYTLCW